MADTIKIKRSTTTPAPTSLAPGELAYSEASGKLFIGRVSDGAPVDIGGKWVTDALAPAAFNASVDARIAAASLDALADVFAPTPSDGQQLTWSAANGRWEAVAPSTGVTQFISLNDTPAAYTGMAGAFVKVNATATALEFAAAIDGGTF